ncbi:Pesticin receptor [Zhongshania aliphaticivorans]|uniref:Pesticin receptor n=1 Tax=Zhongshania aliphaticivorans TaxID=1470434 RepID=A0A5S9PK19_9GAMM|nr:TonB-dependent receptor [Zhongshania aliphaticivorans]CAA0104140.1 Pesticin receptor [Zhongshania aliphaticivorans]CAA0104316.1 Pesticin receptor [Zhongshania aliphaticivorans]
MITKVLSAPVRSAIRNSVGVSTLCLMANHAVAASGNIMLEEVIVTAQKRSQSTQDVPIAVTGMNSNQMEKFGLDNAVDLGAYVPNMQVSGPFGDVQPIFSIRGVSMSDYSANQPSPIGVYIDEAYLAPVYSHGASFFDIERLEVLRGPQGTLYGKNTTGGAINVITRTPKIGDEAEGFVKLGVGNYNAQTTEFGFETTVVPDRVAVRFAGVMKKDDGYIENKLDSQNTTQTDFRAFRLSVSADISDRINAVFKFTKGENDALATTPRNEPRVDISFLGPLSSDSSGFIDYTGYDSTSRGLGFYETESNRVGTLDTNSDLAVLTLNYVADSFTLTSVTAYSDNDYYNDMDIDGSPLHMVENVWSSDAVGFSQDFRISTQLTGPVNFIAGVYYDYQNLYLHNLYSLYGDFIDLRIGLADPDLIPLAPFLLDFGVIDQRMRTEKESYAVYSQFRFDISNDLGVDLGLRYTNDTNDLTYLNVSRVGYDGEGRGSWTPGNTSGVDDAFLAPPLTVTGLTSILQDPLSALEYANTGYTTGPYTLESAPQLSTSEKEITGKLGIDYRFNDDIMVFASYSRGYRSGSFNGGLYYEPRPIETAYARPEYLDAFEIGIKAEAYDGKVRINSAIFDYKYTDQQFINQVFVSAFLENAGGSRIRGAETELWAGITESLSFSLNVGYLDTEFTELSLSNTETVADKEDNLDLSGNNLISAPTWNYSISTDYDIFEIDAGYLTINLNANFQDDQWYSAYNGDGGYGELKQDAYWLFNGRLSWVASDDAYSVSVWGKNLAAKEYDTYAINLQGAFGFDYYIRGAPQTYGLDLKLNF